MCSLLFIVIMLAESAVGFELSCPVRHLFWRQLQKEVNNIRVLYNLK